MPWLVQSRGDRGRRCDVRGEESNDDFMKGWINDLQKFHVHMSLLSPLSL